MARAKLVVDDDIWKLIGASSDAPSGVIAEDLAAQIQALIISEKLEEGTRLPSERDLATMLSTSRPTVSQAIRVLVVRGLVESRRGSGAYVRRRPEATLAASVDLMLNLNHESLTHLSELRLLLETTGVKLAIERGASDEFEEAAAALEALRDAAGDTAAWMSADTRFHAALVRASGNPYLFSIYESVHTSLVDYEYRAWVARGEVPEWLRPEQAAAQFELHEPILEAVREGRYGEAESAVLHHHSVMTEHLRAGLPAPDPQVPSNRK